MNSLSIIHENILDRKYPDRKYPDRKYPDHCTKDYDHVKCNIRPLFY
jgi:hypothetical protein